MTNIHLLIIEDEPSQIEAYGDNIDSYNKKNEIKFTFDVCKSFEEGKAALQTPYYDAAVIDLKLSSGEALEGKDLIEEIYQKIRIPIIVYSGSIGQISDIQETPLLRKKLRTDEFSEVLEEAAKIYKTGITTFLRPTGDIDKKLTNIFWNHLANDINIWIEHNNPDTLLRYIFSHFQEYLEINVDGDFEEYHPFEVYIKPPIKKHLHTGDLILHEGEYFVVLTPACDVVLRQTTLPDGNTDLTRKADKIILVKARKFELNVFCLNKRGELDKGKIKDLVTNQQYRYHYLPSIDGNNGLLIDFQDIFSLEGSSNFNRVASISSSFIKDIISRFSSYYSRQGQPTFNQEKIINDLFTQGLNN